MSGRPVSRSLAPLRGVLPFLAPYRGRIAGGLLALVCSSTATLVLPFMARRLIDQGFIARQAGAGRPLFSRLHRGWRRCWGFPRRPGFISSPGWASG